MINTDGTNKTPLISACGGHTAAWSPDSRRVAFIKYSPARPSSEALALAGLDSGSQATLLTSQQPLSGLAWSPNGRWLAYTAGTTRPLIHVLRLSDLHNDVIAHGRAPQWSPTSQQLEFLWQRPGKREAVTIIDRNGTHARIIDPRAVDPYAQGIGWSPDGSEIIYRREANASCHCRTDLYIQTRDGAKQRPLHRGVANEEFGPIYWRRQNAILYTSLVRHGQ